MYLQQQTEIKRIGDQNISINFNEFKARLLGQLASLESRFPININTKKLASSLLKLANSCLIASTNTDSTFDRLSNESKDDLLRMVELQKEKLRVEVSDLARDLRDTPDLDHHLMLLESLQIQLSQIHSLDMQLKRLIKSYEERQRNPVAESTEQDIKEDEKEILSSISKILETLIAQTEYLMKVKNQAGQDALVVYVDKEFKKYLRSKCKKLYKVFAFGINALITRHKSFKFQVSCLRLLKRFYEIFEKHQVVLEDTILTCLQNFAEIEVVKKHKIAALFYYHLLNSFETTENFKKKLREEKSLEILKFNPHFSSIFYINQVEQENALELNQLHIKSGFPLEQTIQPKQNFKQYIVVNKPQSILHYNFTTQEYNIGFSIEKVGQLKQVSGNWEEVNNEEVGTVLLLKPGVYKAVWHNSYSYLKAKTLKYRIRVLERKDMIEEQSNIEHNQNHLEDLFTVDDLNEKEDNILRGLKQIYGDIVPIIKIMRPSQVKNAIQPDKTQSIVILIEENRCYLKFNENDQIAEQNMQHMNSDTFIQAQDIYVQQINSKQISQTDFNASQFYDDNSQITQIYILTKLPGFQNASTLKENSQFSNKNKVNLRDYIIKAEKILYYTMEKVGFKSKIRTDAEFYFADICDSLICNRVVKLVEGRQDKQVLIFNSGESNILLSVDQEQELFEVQEFSNLAVHHLHGMQKSSDQETLMHQEYLQMVLSYVKVMNDIELNQVQVYEDDSGIELPELEERVHTLREEGLRHATSLRYVYNLFKRGTSTANTKN
ncbi:sec14-like protein 2-like [Stylonychia lemnae]|uniref:Sec14-like protein 2-like n=1 Tax=Stylonychia lemnae TaxID=5949 RepID=A0A078A0Y7_STYLE|nr:sec14-like protein 2-like [Stylonychia lemnae]|eukprot:CDW75143.1 sec14-like protein 2-like [Stylonychia lemnae]